MEKLPKVLIIMGSDSDFPVVEPCITLLRDFAVMADIHICSAHRTPEKAAELARGAEDAGFDVIIAAAGKAAHLPGVLASYTPLPVIGLPVKSSTLDGLDSLLSIVQMPPGIPVATVALDGAENAALLAVQIIASRDLSLREKVRAYKNALAAKVAEKDRLFHEKIRDLLPRS